MQTIDLKKWNRLLRKKYGVKNPTQKEVFEVANTLTNFFELLIKFDQEDRLKIQTNEDEYDRTKTKN